MSFSEIDGPDLRMFATPDPGGSSTGPPREEPTFAEKILALLDQIHAMDKARAAKIIKIKNAIAEGNYYVSAAEVARRIIDQMDEP